MHAEFPASTIERDYDPSLPELIGDREQLIQAVLNIVRNAAQARRARPITFRTRALRQVTIRKQRHKLALELQVIDNGPGVPAEIQDRIFNPLVSGREGGTGLGLSLAQTFVHTTRASSSSSAAGPNHIHDPAAAEMKPVWIVDDDRSIRWVFEKALSREGIAFNTFSSAQEALDALADERARRCWCPTSACPGARAWSCCRR